MATRIRTLNFLPEVFQTPTNAQFLAASLDQLVDQPNIKKIEGYVGSKFGYGINANDYYVTEPTKVRKDYQLDPGVVFTKPNESVAQDFISYPGIVDGLKLEGALTENNDRLFNSQFYSWDSFTELDKIINYNQYYWLPEGPDEVVVATDTVFTINDYIVNDTPNGYNIVPAASSGGGTTNPTITLLRGGTYTFAVNQSTQFWIQGQPGITGYDPNQPNMQTRDVLGVSNNGANIGVVVFSVPNADAQDQYNIPGNNLVDLVSSDPFSEINGARVSDLVNGIDGVTSLEGLTVMFYDPSNPFQVGYISNFYGSTNYDQNNTVDPLVPDQTITVTSASSIGNILICDSTASLIPGGSITFSGTMFGGLNASTTSQPAAVASTALVAGSQYFITTVGNTNWVSAGVSPSAIVTASISGTTMTVTAELSGALVVGQTITGAGVTSGTTIVSYDHATSLITGNPTYIVSTSQTVASTAITGYEIVSGKMFTATGSVAGTGTASEYVPTIYYVREVLSNVEFTLSTEPNGPELALLNGAGSITGNINQGLYEEGYYTNTNQNFYTINYIGDILDPIISLTPAGTIPSNQKITASYGTEWVGRSFFRNIADAIEIIPYLSAPLDTLYYQDGTYSNKVGIIKIVDSNATNPLDVNTDILGQRTYTSPNGVVFTNGLKVVFQGDIIPASYEEGQYYVEGVGTAIELVPATSLVSPESFTASTYIPWDTVAWDIGNWEGNSYIPVIPDYITIARNSLDRNPWSRSNRWFHIDVITATAGYNNNPDSITTYATQENKAKRPIIEFYPDLRLFNSGSEGIAPVDFIDYRTTDAFTFVAGQENYYPDVAAYSSATATISSTDYSPTRTATSASAFTDAFTVNTTDGFNSGDIVTFDGVPSFGGISTGIIYYVKEVLNGTQFTISATSGGDTLSLTTSSGTMTVNWSPQSVTINVAASAITGSIKVGQYVVDSTNLLPRNAFIESITGTTTYTIKVVWEETAGSYFPETSDVALIFTDTPADNYALFDGATIIFAADSNLAVRNKVYVSRFSTVDPLSPPVITLTEIENGQVQVNQQTVILRGYNYKGKDFYFDGINWNLGQSKTTVNQPPLFDVFDANGISFGDSDVYVGTSFKGSTLFAYGIGVGSDDSILGFPLRYSSVDNVGDISFDVSLNSDTFDYVNGSTPVTEQINTGYVYQYSNRTEHNRLIGWQTAVSPSIQYQIFEFDFDVLSPATEYKCDIAPVAANTTNWPTVQVYVNNVILTTGEYSVTTSNDSTTITLTTDPVTNTVIQVLIYSDQVSKIGYYGIPINLNNNPLNQDITVANIGDIRGQYQSIFYNNPDTTGVVFGANNYRDLGNLVPWGNRIIQNSASLVLPGTFLRKQNHNLFNALLFNSREYIKFKTLLVDTVNNSNYQQRFDPSTMLDDALDQITAAKSDNQPFFWSDMLPSKAAYVSNTYSFANSLDVSIYPLTHVYNFASANYNGVLVYLTRTTGNVTTVTQLIINQDYTISSTSPTITVTLDLLPNDIITIKEYNQTYGSYVPNTPTKLGLYPAFIPEVVLDSDYSSPTYFIKGHDGSYNKLYGSYDPVTGILVDFRDQVLLEFETRIYNNLKLSATVPIKEYEVLPGFFRDTDYSYNEWLTMYSPGFLNWVGQNRLDYKRQVFNTNNQFTYNYWQSGNKINKQSIEIGYWRGVYQYFYDTTTPHTTPWEMLGFIEQPTWWETRYGPAPYTSDNLILWGDLAQGINWNNGDPIVVEQAVRPELLEVLPVNSNGELLSPFDAVVGNYTGNTFQRDWKVGDDGPVELSYRRSSSYPFDLMRLLALMKPAQFFNLGVDVDNYKYNEEFNQYLVNNRSHLRINDIEIYGSGTAKTSYINWIVDYEKQAGIDATANITTLLDNLDVRLVYRLAGFSDKTLLKFYVEKGTPNSNNASLLIPDDSYSVLLYDNQPFNRIVYSGVIVQIVNGGYAVFGNSQTNAYFKTLKPKYDGNVDNITVEKASVKVTNNYDNVEVIVPYNTVFYSLQEVAQFLSSYGAYLQSQGMVFDQQEYELEINWKQMIAEFLYWAQTGWDEGSITTLNPAAKILKINKDSNIVQPLTLRQTNFVLNQNLYPIQSSDLSVVRDGTLFSAQALNAGDTISYGQFNISNFEHGIVFDNVTLFNDIIYNLITGLRQTRIALRGSKTADWTGVVDAQGFIYNQNNITEWSREVKYTKGEIVKYKNKYWTALKVIQPSQTFVERDWVRTDYDQIQKGLLPNPSTRSYESSLYYDINKANLENDADLLSFSLIGYRPRDYLALVDLTDITQINVYRNMIKNKGTLNAASAFKGVEFSQGGIDYDIYENWAIKTGEFGGVLNSNFIEFKINQQYLTGNPSIIGLTNGVYIPGVQQEIPLYNLYNYGRPITSVDVLPQISSVEPSMLYPDAGYVNFNDVKMSSYFYSQLPVAVDASGTVIPISDFYVRDYVWLANYLEKWQVFTPSSIGQVVSVDNNLNGTATVTFLQPHTLSQFEPLAIVNFNDLVNGYYIANIVIDQYKIMINLSLDPSITNITGQGIAFKFQSQRVDTPADIANLPLLDSEFIKNTVWVDTGPDGSWAVYRKGINYQLSKEFLKTNSVTYGSAVATGSKLGYLVGDSGVGSVYRYIYNPLSQTYDQDQIITEDVSFGSAIAYSDEIYVISQPTGTPSGKIHIYQLNDTLDDQTLSAYQVAISAPAGSVNWGAALAISGDKNWIFVSDYDNTINPNLVHVYRRSQVTGFYEAAGTITTSGLTLGDNFGYSLSTDYYGSILVVGTPNQDYSVTIDNYGKTYVFNRSIQNIEVQTTSIPSTATKLPLAWSPTTLNTSVSATTVGTNIITCGSTTGFQVDYPIVFSGAAYLDSEIEPDVVYFIHSIVSPTTFKIKTTKAGTSPLVLGTSSGSGLVAYVQTTPIFVSVNGTLVDDSNYGIIDGNVLCYTSNLNAGDIVTVSDRQFTLLQTLTTEATPRVGVQFGKSVDTTTHASEILVGAPFELNANNQEGAVYRFTNAGGKYGTVIGTSTVNVTTVRNLLINGFLVRIPPGDATVAASAINQAAVPNVQAQEVDSKLVISLVANQLAPVNEKLLLSVIDTNTIGELGLSVFTQTQIINCPHTYGPTQFGTTVKFNEYDSFIASAPTGTRYEATTFDFSDDENQDDDTIFDNNTTQWIDTYPNAGAAYMFDYVQEYEENLLNIGKFVYAQSVNARNEDNGLQPLYGTAIDFNNYQVALGTPGFRPSINNGQVIAYTNTSGVKDWSIYRSSSAVVDINRIYNIQLFSASTNNTLINLDYIDPLQGKILGAVRENIDIVSNADPATYNTGVTTPKGLVWGSAHVGKIWFDTTNVRFVNYHQNDVTYNSKYWATLFPGSDVAVYTWVASNVLPTNYTGPGTPYDINAYTVQYVINPSGALSPTYYFWARNTNTVFAKEGKTLADSVIASYIQSPKDSGISYFTPLLPSVYALYNSGEYINANDSVLHVGFATGTNDDVTHNQYSLIRANLPSDFLPGVPTNINGFPESLYDRLLDSLCGVDETGEVVPNPYLPKAVQYGIMPRPRQSFFINRFGALKNYLTYANEVLSQIPISETRQSVSFLTSSSEFYDTANYWEYINWWATGYSDNTKSAMQVAKYSDLATLSVDVGTIVTVAANGDGKFEVYIFTTSGTWNRIGLENGTIRFKSTLWDYETARLGFGDNFYDTTPYDEYPSEETRKIIRALNEQIYIQDLLIYRNKSLILLFEYIQSETIESQNYLPWLNKTSFIDVAHTIRELRPIEVFQTDNQEFLSGYMNEVKPYHVVIKEFLFKYTGTDVFEGNLTDFDLPAKYNSSIEQFVTPELVYSNANDVTTFLPTSSIWEEPEYTEWFQNKGVSLAGENNVLMTTLSSYVTLNSTEFSVDNAQGFPINGTIVIGTEEIGYSLVNRALNVIGGLTRGLNGTTIATHNPGEEIYMDLPAVVLLDGGRGYTEPPQAIAYIDTTIHPEPTTPAQLSVVMNLDSVLRVDVIDPGQGYSVLPEIVIGSAFSIVFSSADVNTFSNTIQLYSPGIRTGDLVRYVVGEGSTAIGGLENNQWYYVNVLENNPTVVLGLYASYFDAYYDRNRIVLYSQGTGTTQTLNAGARASTITSAAPIRENSVTLRFDRTTYTSQVIDWVSGRYYGAFFAGESVTGNESSSSSIQLESTEPPINNILASSEGVTFQVSGVRNDQLLTYSSFIRHVSQTLASGNRIRLIPQDDGSNNPNASGTTIGFYVGMPIKFTGGVIGGLVSETEYYVHTIYDSLDFAVSATPSGSQVTLTNATVGAVAINCYVGEVTNTAVIEVIYPGISKVAATTAGTNTITIPLDPTGTGGTLNFYTNATVFFTGTMFGGIVENQIYYVVSVLDNETFTMSATQNPTTYSATETKSATDTIVLTTSAETLAINEPIVFSDMEVSSAPVTSFGGISSSTIYYVVNIVSASEIQISETVNGPVLSLTSVTGTMTATSQASVVQLTTASGTDMTINVNLPVSPGQVNGHLFNFYQTSEQYPGLTGTLGNLFTRDINAVLSGSQSIALSSASGGISNVYLNMPLRLPTAIGSLLPATTYYVVAYDTVGIEVTNTSSSGNLLTCDDTSYLYIDMPIVFTLLSLGGIILNTTYYVHSVVNSTQFRIKTTVSAGSAFTLTTANGSMIGTGSSYIKLSTTVAGSEIDPGNSQQTATISIGSPAVITVATPPANGTRVKFNSTGILPVGMTEGLSYYVRNVSGSSFNISLTPTGALITTSGVQSGVQTMLLSSTYTIGEYTTDLPVFNVGSALGGYNALVTYAGSGLVADNIFTILGTDLGGTTPTNDLVITVNSVNATGGVLTWSTSGTAPGETNSYYLKVISANEFEVYSNSLMTVPVSGINFPYTGITTATATDTTSGTNVITVDDTTGFNLYDPVVFTGAVIGGLVQGDTYYIYTLTPTTITVSTVPADAGTVVSLTTDTSDGFTMGKLGSLISLPTPFTFNQSIVKYNNRVYQCIISNNDPEFVFGKWELLNSGDRKLNALDRIIGYYQPTANMPGLDLTQLVQGITYPNSTYQGNAFEPDQQFQLDTLLSDKPFTPGQVYTNSLIWNGVEYIGVADVGTSYSAIVRSADAVDWTVQKLANADLDTTAIIKAGSTYVVTTRNTATPIYRSANGLVWSIRGQDLNRALNAAAYKNGVYVAVGDSIVASSDSLTWTEVQTLPIPTTDELFDVEAITLGAFDGLVAVGKGQVDFNGLGVFVDVNLLYTSTNGLSWTAVPTVTRKGFYATASDGTSVVAVGEDGVIYKSGNASSWSGINETVLISVNEPMDIINVASTEGLTVNTPVRFTASFNVISSSVTYYVVAIPTLTQVQVSTTIGGSPVALTSINPLASTYMYVYPRTASLVDIAYGNSKFIAVGNAGLIKTSSNGGVTWSTSVSGTVKNLNSVAYNSDSGEWIVGGDNIILTSANNGLTWDSTTIVPVEPTVYDVQGDEFQAGYGPEELVPGVVTDNLTMTVATRPGTNWPATLYEHVGYRVVSMEFTPTSGLQTDYSFDRMVETPAQLTVSVIDGTTGLGTTIYQPDYTVNWITNVVTLAIPLAFTPVADRLRIDVYETGNGDQLVKADTKTDPIRTNTTTGFNEIYINANYAASIYSGSGVVRPDTTPIETTASSTESANNYIVVDDASKFILNDAVTFHGDVLGGLVEDTLYYVKTISVITNRITVSDSFNYSTGTAGSTFALTNDTGLMHVIIRVGPGTPWTDPIALHNGTKLVHGSTGTVTRTKASTNTITCNTTAALAAGIHITFSNTIFGGVIEPLVEYTILAIVDANEFTLEDPDNPGNALVLTNATGGAIFVSNDYAFGIAENGISASIIFAKGDYNVNTDFITYTAFGETLPIQYGYTLPETQIIPGTGATTYSLDNYVSGDNPTNAIVEVNGLRQSSSAYTIDDTLNQIVFTSAPTVSDTVAVTTFNLTDRQYLNTQFGITGKTVSSIVNISNTISLPLATKSVTATTAGTNYLTCSSTTDFVAGQTIIFKGTGFGNVLTDGTVYFVGTIVSPTQFTIVDENSNTIVLTTASGIMVAYVGGNPAVRITTNTDHNLSENDLVVIDGVQGSVQLNNNTYYAKIISSVQFDLYEQPYDPAFGAVNYPIETVSSYTGSGYVWAEQDSFVLVDTTATATSIDPILGSRITVTSTEKLVPNTPVIFTGTVFGNIVAGTTYYVKEVVSLTEFSISSTWGGTEFELVAASGSMNVTQWEQDNVDRLWVTLNGYRVPSTSLYLNPDNALSILAEIQPTDEIIITSMMPSATPDEEVFMLEVNQLNQPLVRRANTQTRTWLTQAMTDTTTIIHVNDVSRITNTIIQNVTTPVAVDGNYIIGLLGDKNSISQVTVYNNTTSTQISSDDFEVVVVDQSPTLILSDVSGATAGDSLTLTILVGNLLYINGEKIRFSTVDVLNNTVTGLQRGANGTAVILYSPAYTEVYSLLTDNIMNPVDYDLTWNSYVYNTTDGDPLQISTTASATFLKGDIN